MLGDAEKQKGTHRFITSKLKVILEVLGLFPNYFALMADTGHPKVSCGDFLSSLMAKILILEVTIHKYYM